ncbi:DNA polymerase III subunit delta [Roseobacter sp. HKCCD9010]|uniref:DNA polymerase III subunit delta n=1 Tax=unclassified Roseobacter TaxID=196798 RepID=UPI0014918996|nr:MULTISPECIES: DNA polymerase III subunit delta [unclassified Roseobacter]MBF9048573.1 DNA polymerase III subunit delta [Rhodobacterales bacterium HKCCD4356]NNV10572.1 DNA polymerase III subunit delta [Roseobacter sp. HKCCD7357]NNV14757.1 DNA polymerase III subunit delta [Roseobacter sp. HKCCD8768]NNV24216.1 DNA polymerase III subunit delta [Roseobacter sp. HKCCD8192]NNV28473.1 DNA polymerase III subunit delta [Roseobacter sp. HKCCD9061]
MKLGPRDAAGYFARPNPDATGLLIYGADAMRVALKRQQMLEALLGPEAEAEMRLTRIPASDLRSDRAALLDAIKAQGFFPGPRAAFVEDAGDGLAPTIKTALDEWQPGDAQIIVTAKQLNARSALRKLFEAHQNAYAVGIYDDPPSRAEIEETLQKAGIAQIGPDAMTDLTTLAQSLDPGDFRQTVEKLALYKHGDPTPVAPEDVAACAPATIEAELDDILHAAAEAQAGAIGPLITRLGGQGVQPVGLCIAALRHFRMLHMAASHPNGASAGIAAARPPIFGPRRDRMTRQAQNWGMHNLEAALSLLVETDLSLRSTQQAPQMALMERALIRLAMMRRG